MSDATLVRYEADGGVALLTLDSPPANTYSYDLNRRLDEAILRARMDDAVHVIVIRGAGERFFCAGADIGMLQGAEPSFKYWFCLHANETLLRLENTPKLVIAASRSPWPRTCATAGGTPRPARSPRWSGSPR